MRVVACCHGNLNVHVKTGSCLLDSSLPRELSRILAVPVSAGSRALAGLERDVTVAGRLVGRSRVYTLNPRYFTFRNRSKRRFILGHVRHAGRLWGGPATKWPLEVVSRDVRIRCGAWRVGDWGRAAGRGVLR
jgi:hypothetical protein